MKKYEKPIFEVINLNSCDVIQTSATNIPLEKVETGDMADLSGGKITFN